MLYRHCKDPAGHSFLLKHPHCFDDAVQEERGSQQKASASNQPGAGPGQFSVACERQTGRGESLESENKCEHAEDNRNQWSCSFIDR